MRKVIVTRTSNFRPDLPSGGTDECSECGAEVTLGKALAEALPTMPDVKLVCSTCHPVDGFLFEELDLLPGTTVEELSEVMGRAVTREEALGWVNEALKRNRLRLPKGGEG